MEPYHLLWLHLKVMFNQLTPLGTCLVWVIRTKPLLRMWKRLLLFITMASQNLGWKLALTILDHFGASMSIIQMILLGNVISWSHSQANEKHYGLNNNWYYKKGYEWKIQVSCKFLQLEKASDRKLVERAEWSGHGGWIWCHPIHFLPTRLPSWHNLEDQSFVTQKHVL